MELISEVKALRSNWLNQVPIYQHFNRVRHDWIRKKGGFWDRVRFNTAEEAKKLVLMEGEVIETARESSAMMRETFRDAGQTVDNVSLAGIKAKPVTVTPGWNNDDIDVWRLAGVQQLDAALDTSFEYCPPYYDWLSAEIDLRKLREDRQSWVRFWFYDARVSKMPKFWIRSTFEILQSVRRISDGTPCDT